MAEFHPEILKRCNDYENELRNYFMTLQKRSYNLSLYRKYIKTEVKEIGIFGQFLNETLLIIMEKRVRDAENEAFKWVYAIKYSEELLSYKIKHILLDKQIKAHLARIQMKLYLRIIR